MYTDTEIFITIVAIGVFTYMSRLVFLFFTPRFLSNQRVKTALDAIPAAMLVALVVPTTLFVNGKIDPFRVEVLAIVLTVPIVYRFRYSGLGLIASVILLMLFSMI